MKLRVDIKKKYPLFALDVAFETDDATHVLALLGASGCGKSMTLNCIAGILKPDDGYIEIDGDVLFDSKRGINKPPKERRVGLLFQNYALFPNMTVKNNILAGMRRFKQQERLMELLHAFRVEDVANHYPSQLSGGQQQRAALARIFASRPRLLLLDEPLSALDSWLRWQLEQELNAVLEQYGGGTVYVSHNRDEVYRLCEDVVVINNGKSEPLTRVKDLFAAPKTLNAALLSGCKNFSRARKTGECSIFASDWNHTLVSSAPVPEDIRFVGVRAHYIEPGMDENRIPCVVQRVTDDVFSTILTLRPLGAPDTGEYARLRVELGKGTVYQAGQEISVGFLSENLLLLK